MAGSGYMLAVDAWSIRTEPSRKALSQGADKNPNVRYVLNSILYASSV